MGAYSAFLSAVLRVPVRNGNHRRRFNRSFWITPVSWLFYGGFVLAGLWYGPRDLDSKLAKFEPAAPPAQSMPLQHWQQSGWAELPGRRNEFDDDQRWPLDVQAAGDLAQLRQRLQAAGWRVQPQAGWEQALQMLDTDIDGEQVPVLPAALDTRVEALLMLRPGNAPGQIHALRLWPSSERLQPGDLPLWLGTAQTLQFQHHLGLIGLWRPIRGTDPALEAVRHALADLEPATGVHPDTGQPVLRVQLPAR